MKKLLIILFSLSMLGCTLTPPPEGGIKKVNIKPFTNHTVQYALHTELFNLIEAEFLRDSYLEVVSEAEAEYIVSGTITNYDLRPIAYSIANKVESYEMIIEVKVKIHDTLENETVWEEIFDTNEIYFTKEGNPTETKSDAELEQETQKQALDLLARDITRKVVYAK